jgi:hypothetical protein
VKKRDRDSSKENKRSHQMNISQMFKTTQRFMRRSALALAAAIVFGGLPAARAAISITDTTVNTGASGETDSQVVTKWTTAQGSAPVDTVNDLLKNHATASMSAGGVALGSLANIKDGLMLSGGKTSSSTDGLALFTSTGGWTAHGPADLVFTLDASYNIGRIDTFTLWDPSRTGQKYDLYGSTNGGTTWNLVTAVSYNGSAAGSNRDIRRISLADSAGGAITGLTGVNALKFHIMDPGPGGSSNFDNISIYAEIAAYAAAPSLADAANSTVVASPTTVASDGVTESTVTVTLKDATSAAVPGKTVTLASSRGAADTISAASGVSSGSGVVTFTVKSSTAGSPVFTATDTTDSVTVAQTATVTFLSAAVSAANSTVSASPTSVAADGSTTSTVTVTVKDSSSAAISGKTVTLAKTSGPGSPVIDPSSATTDGSGIATFTVQSTTAGADVFTATADSVAITQTATVTFTAGAVSAGVSTVVASPAIVPADGVASSTVTVTLKDANSNPVTNKTVTLVSDRGATDTISAASGPSSASGVVTFTVTSLTAGGSVFTATGDGVALSTTPGVTFGASAAASTVVADPTSVLADGTTTSTITVTLKDGSNNAIPNKTVTLVSSRGATDTIADASGVSDVSGVVTFTVKSSTAGSPVFTATDTTDGVTVTQTATVTFTVGAVSAAQSTVAASPASVMANGTSTSTITVTLKDANNNLIAGKTVTLDHTSGPGTPVITTLSGTTSASGVATFTVKSTTVGADVFTATDDTDSLPITQTATVTFTTVPAIITWGPATNDTLNAGSTAFLETDVKTNGKFVAAVCNGTAGTVNGVTFTGWTSYNTDGTYLITYGASPITMQWAGSRGDVNWGRPSNGYGNFGYEGGNNKLLLTGGGEGLSPNTITLSSLVAGNTYQVQIWAPTWNGSFNISVGGVTLRVGNPPGTLSQYVVGTFTANGTSQPISCSGVAPSAISVRDISLPKGTLIMFF